MINGQLKDSLEQGLEQTFLQIAPFEETKKAFAPSNKTTI